MENNSACGIARAFQKRNRNSVSVVPILNSEKLTKSELIQLPDKLSFFLAAHKLNSELLNVADYAIEKFNCMNVFF